MLQGRKKYIWWTLAAALGLAAVLFVAAAVTLRQGGLKTRVAGALADALNCDVSINTLEVRLLPVMRVSGSRLTIRLRDRPELPPFVEVDRFNMNLGLLSVLRRHVDTIHLDGLHLNVPPHRARTGLRQAGGAGATAPHGRPLFSVSHIITHDATLAFVGKFRGNWPLAVGIHDLDVADAAVGRAVQFTSRVITPAPKGLVDVSGTFGPWNRDDPTSTPTSGSYTLVDGDLGTINGLGGRVSSTGTFTGELTEIHVNGISTTPDFSLDLGGKPLPLTTRFQMTVDGTNGTTRLDRMDVQLASTTLVVTGALTNLPGAGNLDFQAAVEVTSGRVEDLLRLVIDTPIPVMTGNVSLNATFLLPPGPGGLRQRVQSAGTFGLGDARFTDVEMLRTIHELSRRGQGKGVDETLGQVPMRYRGRFTLGAGRVRLPRLTVSVPGADISVAGQYTLGDEQLDFTGTVRLKASLSKAVGGFRSIFLRPFNPLFRRDGAGAVIPIKVTGTRDQPKFGVRMKDIFKKEK